MPVLVARAWFEVGAGYDAVGAGCDAGDGGIGEVQEATYARAVHGRTYGWIWAFSLQVRWPLIHCLCTTAACLRACCTHSAGAQHVLITVPADPHPLCRRPPPNLHPVRAAAWGHPAGAAGLAGFCLARALCHLNSSVHGSYGACVTFLYAILPALPHACVQAP